MEAKDIRQHMNGLRVAGGDVDPDDAVFSLEQRPQLFNGKPLDPGIRHQPNVHGLPHPLKPAPIVTPAMLAAAQARAERRPAEPVRARPSAFPAGLDASTGHRRCRIVVGFAALLSRTSSAEPAAVQVIEGAVDLLHRRNTQSAGPSPSPLPGDIPDGPVGGVARGRGPYLPGGGLDVTLGRREVAVTEQLHDFDGTGAVLAEASSEGVP